MRRFIAAPAFDRTAKRLELTRLPPHDDKGLLPPIDDEEGHYAPYRVSLETFLARFLVSPARARLCASLLELRRRLHELGMRGTFQWVSGSFVENHPLEPEDMDVVVFFERTGAWKNPKEDEAKMARSPELFDRAHDALSIDASYVVLHQESTIARAIHYYALYAHTRSRVWKGFVELPGYDVATDAAADAIVAKKRASYAQLGGGSST